MTEDELTALRDQARTLCAEKGLAIIPYGPSWWIVGEGVSHVIPDLAGLSLKALETLKAKGPRINYREAAPSPREGYFRCMKVTASAASSQ